MLGSLMLYLRGMRIMMFQLSGFYCRDFRAFGCKGLGFRSPRVQGFWGFFFEGPFSVCKLSLLQKAQIGQDFGFKG